MLYDYRKHIRDGFDIVCLGGMKDDQTRGEGGCLR